MDCFYCGNSTFDAGEYVCCTSCATLYDKKQYIPHEVEQSEEDKRNVER